MQVQDKFFYHCNSRSIRMTEQLKLIEIVKYIKTSKEKTMLRSALVFDEAIKSNSNSKNTCNAILLQTVTPILHLGSAKR